MPLFGHSRSDEDQAADGDNALDFGAVLEHFNKLPLAERAAEVLAGISSELPQGERSAMDKLLSHGCQAPPKNVGGSPLKNVG
jgi:hypothetical protein